jgi:2-aminoethylphosphonate-pyruvate transaminase
MTKNILLNPGPVTLSDRVRQALLKPDLCHREAEFSQLQRSIRDKLLQVYDLEPDRWAAVLLTGSGTAAVEAMLSTLIPENGKLLILANGVYGDRLAKIASIYKINYLTLQHPWGAAIDRQQLETCLRSHPDLTHVAVVHHETTTGRLNDLQELSTICQPYGVKILADAVSSFGAEEINFDRGTIAVAATANKCLHGVPGTAFVAVDRHILATDSHPRNLYLDLQTYCQQQDRDATPFTQSVQTFYALDEALDELAEAGGWRSRREHYARLLGFVRQKLLEMGIKPLLPDGCSSVVLNSFYLPEGIDYPMLHDRLKERGYTIYSGQGELARSIFRISTMGAIAIEDLEDLVLIIDKIISRSP